MKSSVALMVVLLFSMLWLMTYVAEIIIQLTE